MLDPHVVGNGAFGRHDLHDVCRARAPIADLDLHEPKATEAGAAPPVFFIPLNRVMTLGSIVAAVDVIDRRRCE